ncbi:MAG: amino acid permease [Candidatus Aminicenantes bacterium]|nr:amino acid permease [Candidatus Aminicenantes bacterium]
MNDNKAENGLQRKLGLFPLTNIVIANMIGAGIFTTSGLLMAGLHNPLIMFILWLVGGIIALCGALSYGELGAAIPRAGGEYAFLSSLYHPIFGFLSGWVSFFAGFSAPIAASAIGFSEYLTWAFPGLLNPGIFPESAEAVIFKKFYAILVIVIFVYIHSRGLNFGVKVQNYLTILKVGLIVGLVFFGFLIGKGSAGHLAGGKEFTFNLGGWKTIGLSLMWIMFAYSGWNASAYIGSEIKNPARNLPRSLILGTGIVVVLYFCLNLFYIYGVPPEDMEGVIPIAGAAAGNLFGKSFESILSIIISFALFSSLSAYIILGPRVYYSMARDRLFFRFASQVHKKYGVPSKSIFLQGIIAVLMVTLGTFDQILTYMGFSLGIFPILAVFGIFKLRRLRRGSSTAGNSLNTYHMPGYPVVPIIYILTTTVILSLAFFERPVESSIAILMAVVGIPVFLIFKKGSATPQGEGELK